MCQLGAQALHLGHIALRRCIRRRLVGSQLRRRALARLLGCRGRLRAVVVGGWVNILRQQVAPNELLAPVPGGLSASFTAPLPLPPPLPAAHLQRRLQLLDLGSHGALQRLLLALRPCRARLGVADVALWGRQGAVQGACCSNTVPVAYRRAEAV